MSANTSVFGLAKTLPSRGFRRADGGGNSHQQAPLLAVYYTPPAGPKGEAETTQRERIFQCCMKDLESCWKSREVAGQNPSGPRRW